MGEVETTTRRAMVVMQGNGAARGLAMAGNIILTVGVDGTVKNGVLYLRRFPGDYVLFPRTDEARAPQRCKAGALFKVTRKKPSAGGKAFYPEVGTFILNDDHAKGGVLYINMLDGSFLARDRKTAAPAVAAGDSAPAHAEA